MKPGCPTADRSIAAAQAAFALLAERFAGSRWDLLVWEDERPRFLLGRLQEPHSEIARLDEESQRPPFLLEPRGDGRKARQLSLAFCDTGEAEADWLWPFGRRGEAPWICGRMPRSLAAKLARCRHWLGPLFDDLGADWSRASLTRRHGRLELQSIIHSPSSPLAALLEQVERIARTETPVFLQGESGVGKELFARAIHALSPRAPGGFVAQNGGALTDTLIESELFGHSRGSFTGAREERVGLIELANAGTFFLDEVGDLSPMLQVRLLRVLQDKRIRRVGENKLRPVDFRLVTATHRDMASLVESGSFRLDLWYRIQGMTLRIPALRERPMDVPLLARFVLAERAESYQLHMREISEDAMEALLRYPWPGNVRELQNELARVLALYGDSPRVERWMLSESLFAEAGANLPAGPSGLTLQEAQVDLERRMIRQTLGRFGGNRSRSARALGLSRQGLLKKLRRLGLERVALRPRPGG